jgi:gamma-glutamyltranspeptidase/glutathione hydrolase
MQSVATFRWALLWLRGRPYLGSTIRLLAGLAVGAVWIGPARAETQAWVARGRQVMIASDHVEASRAGVEILRAGGNAVDAACAVSFALAVVRPQSTGLGGGGFFIARFAESGRVVVWDFRETAPEAAAPDMYERAMASAPGRAPPHRFGYLAAATPGLLAGRLATLEQLGTRTLAEVMAPAVRLAERGFAVDQHYVDAVTTVAKSYARWPELRQSCSYVWKVHLAEGNLPRPGDLLRQPALARLLRAIAEHGSDFFYRGPVAAALERDMRAHGGIMTRQDLERYRPLPRRPLSATYRGYEILTMPPPSSGGVCLIEALNILETVDLPALARSDRPLAIHYLVEAMKHAFADRARWMADPDFAPVPVELLTSKPYARQLALGLDPGATADSDTYGTQHIPMYGPWKIFEGALPDDRGTSHFCVIDRWGNCVVSTETINTSFGSLAAVGEWGLILNDEMDDFTALLRRPNAFDLIQSERNAVAPRKRPLSSMAPTIVLRGGRPYLLAGGSGGPRIISSVLNVLVRVMDLGESLPQAIAARRVHHQWQPDEVVFDAPAQNTPFSTLGDRGHALADYYRTGIVQAVLRTENEMVGVSDPRKGGQPAGY